jgi:hypothetical protein
VTLERTRNFLDYMFQMMLEVYVRAGLLTNAKELIKKELPKSIDAYCALFAAYGNNQQASVATRMLYDLLQTNDTPKVGIMPNTQLFNIVMQAWSTSKNLDDAYDQINTLFETIRNHPKCRRYNIRPDIHTYMIILQSILSLDVAQ